MQYGLTIPNVGQFGDALVLADLAVAAEASGWDGCFFWDHLLYHQRDWPVADPWIAVAAAAVQTQRIRLGVLVAALPRYRPWRLATVATLDLLSEGRLAFAAALGSIPEEYGLFGEPADAATRAERLDEALNIVDRLWRGEAVTHHGTHYDVATEPLLPTPQQRPRPPVWIGGRWPARRPFRRAACWDGVMPTHVDYGPGETISPGALAPILDYTRAQRSSDEPFDVVLEGESPGEQAAGAAMLAPYADLGLTWWVEKLGWWRGNLAEAFRRIEAGPPR